MKTARKERRRSAKKAVAPKKPETKKPQITPVTPEQILGRAMLANVRIRTWEARKHDREVTQEVAENHNAGPDAGRYHKHLFGGSVKELGEMITAVQVLRRTHYAETLPWTDEGWRILPSANFANRAEKMRAAKSRFEQALENLLAVYEHWAFTEAPKRLGTLYRKSDYPSVADVRKKYSVEFEYAPIPAASDFRVTLPSEQIDAVKQEVEDRVMRAVNDAMREAWSRLGDAVARLKDRLSTEDGKALREPVLEGVRTTAEALGRMNITNDPQLEETRAKIVEALEGYSAEGLRNNSDTRKKVTADVDEILKSMAGLYTA